MKKPIITISLVVWNGKQYLSKCLDSIANQEFQDFELLILDNGSTDGTREFLEQLNAEKYHIRTIEYLPKNIGFAAGHNYISGIVEFCKKNPHAGSAAGILLQPRNEKRVNLSTALRVDSAGLEIFRNRRIAEIEDAEERPKEVFGVSAAAAMYRK